VEVLTSSSNGSICELFNKAKAENVIKGQLMCQTSATWTNSSTSEDGSSSNSTTIASTKSNHLSGGAIGGISVGTIFGAAALLIVSFVFYRRRRKMHRVSGGLSGANGGQSESRPTKTPAELSSSERQELPSSEHENSLRYGLKGKLLRPATAELHGQHGVSGKRLTQVQEASEMESTPAPTAIISELPAMHGRKE